jgi:hypothetical protein
MLASLLASMVVTSASAAPARPPINPDALTISGRFGLPDGEGLITYQRLRVGQITLTPEATAGLKDDASDLRFAVEQGLTKSLHNHGLLARPDDTDPVVLSIDIPALTYTEVADTPSGPGSTLAEATLIFTTTSADAPLMACVTYTAQGAYKAMHRQKSGDGKRAVGIMAAVVIGALNPYAINTFTPQSFSNADLENKNLNAGRSVSSNEGVSPGFDAHSNTLFAATNALQLGIYNYLFHHLKENIACVSPAHQAKVTQRADSPAAASEPGQMGKDDPDVRSALPTDTSALPAPIPSRNDNRPRAPDVPH